MNYFPCTRAFGARPFVYAVSLAALAICLCASGEDTKQPSADDEAKIAAQEDADGDANMDKDKSTFTGLIALENGGAADDHGAIGKLVATDGKVFILKSASDGVLEKIKPMDGKIATLAGKLRVKGKYLVVMAVLPATSNAGQRDKQKKNGF